ncbi:PAS domain-containing protein [Hymenobacter sp. HSC-4F20]|uniref:PAS domain-containing protein n=1 Tax=Hymenobacter sp. HSC-4F20 TaxID=2864135 RepID=UPI001C732F09|nr:PAS domain-containing protein [Hymenobacter sp. HSC-4F20]MBX0293090.1 PAS domain-containing protein [Hymenobacter sp. HSC-4F20]
MTSSASAYSASDELLQAVLEVASTGLALLRPVLTPGSATPVDFVYQYLNPAAQHLLGLPARPTQTHQTLFPQATASGALAVYQRAFEGEIVDNYPATDWLAERRQPLLLTARRSGELLVVNFTEAGEPGAGEQPEGGQEHGELTTAQQLAATTQALAQARAASEATRQHLHRLFQQAPACIATLEGPELVFTLVNPPYQQLVGERQLLGLPLRQAWPDLAGQPFYDLLEGVYRTGETYYGNEQLASIDRANTGQPEPVYFNFIYQAIRDAGGLITGVTIFAYDITEQVVARRQVQHLYDQLNAVNEELAAANEELQVTNEELLTSNAELQRTHLQLQELNQELEHRVQQRTQQLQQARAEAERQRAHLERLFLQAPAAICILRGEQLVYELVNAGYQHLFPGRELLGRPLLQALPEIADHDVYRTFRQVYTTGITHQELNMRVPLTRPDTGELEERYFHYIQQAYYAEDGRIDGVIVFAFEVTEQVRARRASEAAARQLRLVTDALPVLISYVDQAETYQFVNQAYEGWLQRPAHELLGQPLRAVLGEAAYQSLHPYIKRALAGETLDFETRLTYPHGGSKYVRASYVPDIVEGQVLGAYAVVSDVTSLVEARQEAERQRQLLHQLFLEAPAPIVILDGPDFIYQLVNPAYQRIFPGRELRGKPLREALPEVAGTFIDEVLEQVYHTGETAVFQELPLQLARTAGGPLEEIFWTFTYQARRNAEGEVDGILVFAHEVTDQVRARRVVERNEQYLRQMADNVPAMIWLTDAAGQCQYLNRQWYEYTGQTEAEGLGLGWLEALHPDDREATRITFQHASEHQAPFSLLYRQRRHDGRYRWAIDTGLPRFSRSGLFEGFVGTVFDIHEQKQGELALQRLASRLRTARDEAQALNAELQVSNEQLRRTNVDLDSFIYTASHDLKTPITNIEGLLHLLQDHLGAHPTLAAELQPVLGMMHTSVERFQRTLEHLSDVTKLQKEHASPVTEVELQAVVEDVRQDLLPLLEEAQAQVEVDVADCPHVSFSVKNLRSVVYNLLTNALKYRHPDRVPHVLVRCRPAGAYTVLEVQDNGLGLEPGKQAELFTMFRRFHAHVEGSGVGLFMVKRMVENVGGRVEVDSEPGRGSTFRVYFPG